MSGWALARSVLLAALTASLCGRVRADDGDDADPNAYNTEGIVEIGGSLALSWTEGLFAVELDPSVGWFVQDAIELTAFLRFGYLNGEVAPGARTHTVFGAIVLEPSYHFALPGTGETVFGFGGLGFGVGHDGDHFDLEVIPRLGVNIEVGRSGILTPALRVPVLVGRSHGGGDDVGTAAGLLFEVGLTSTVPGWERAMARSDGSIGP
jgi:hypothetical protein